LVQPDANEKHSPLDQIELADEFLSSLGYRGGNEYVEAPRCSSITSLSIHGAVADDQLVVTRSCRSKARLAALY
jgi:hypothetical protein